MMQLVTSLVLGMPRTSGSAPTPAPTLSALSGTFILAENSAEDTVAGAIVGKTSGSILSLTDDAGGRVKLSGLNIVAGATATDYESATSHSFTVRETLEGASNTPRDTVLTLNVTNVFEAASLNALSLDDTEIVTALPSTINILGATSGSTITGTVPTGLTLNSGARTITGTPTTVAVNTFDLVETLADSANSPRTTEVSLEVVEAPVVLTDPPLLVDSISGSGSGGSISASGLTATGSNRQVFAMVGSGTSDGPTDVTLSITGSSGTVAMTRVFFLGTNNESPAAAFECFAGFTADEADLAAAGDGPYSFSGTISAPGSVDFYTFAAGSVEDAPNAPEIVTNRTNFVTGTPSTDKSFIFAGLGSSTPSSGANMTGATQIENVFAASDGLQLGHVTQTTATELTVTNTVVARSVSALAIYAP